MISLEQLFQICHVIYAQINDEHEVAEYLEVVLVIEHHDTHDVMEQILVDEMVEIEHHEKKQLADNVQLE